MESIHNDYAEEPVAASYNGQPLPIWSKEKLTAVLSEVKHEDIPWAIQFLVDKLAYSKPNKTKPVQPHVWDAYQLSPEILAMMPRVRHHVPRDYKDALTDILERKYR